MVAIFGNFYHTGENLKCGGDLARAQAVLEIFQKKSNKLLGGSGFKHSNNDYSN